MPHPLNQPAGQQRTFGVLPSAEQLPARVNRLPDRMHEDYQRFCDNVELKRPLKPEAAVSDIIKPTHVLVYLASSSNQESTHGPQA